MQPSKLANYTCLLLFLFTLAFYFYGLGHVPLIGADEPRYAQVAREMFFRRNLITPTLGGYPWFEKPVLLYWMMMVSFKLFGVSETAARLGPAICGLLTIAAVYLLSRRVQTRVYDSQLKGFACTSALVTASTAGIIVFSRAASFDMVVTMTITWSLVFFLMYELETAERQNRLALGFYICVGLSLLAKGLIGVVIPGGVVASYYLLRREIPPRQLLATLLWGMPLSLAVAGIWYGPMIVRHGSTFVNEFFVQHHFARFFSDKYHHDQPIYYYPLVLLLLLLPWTVFVIDGVAQAAKSQWCSNNPDQKFRVFTFAWLVFPLIFFSLSKSKLPGYVLPVLPAAALMAAEQVRLSELNQSHTVWSQRITGALLVLIAAAGLVYSNRPGHASASCMVAVGAPLIVAGMFVGRWQIIKSRLAEVVVAAVLLSCFIAAMCGLSELGRTESLRDLIQLADSRGYGSSLIYSLHKTDRTAEFYGAGRVVYGPDGQPVRFEGAAQVVQAAQATSRPILVVVPVEHTDQLTALRSCQTEIVGNNGAVALVALTCK